MKGILFQYPAFLFGLTALSVPLVIHLINRNVPRRVVFSSIRFIQKAQFLKTGKKYIRDWWVLLARLIILSLLVLLFASPMIAVERIIENDGKEEVVLFYDLSLSMNSDQFQSFIREQTRKVLANHTNARFAFIASSNKIEKTIAFGSSREEIMRSVEQLTPTLVEGHHEDGLAATEKIFTGAERGQKIIYIFSDLQRQDWATSRLPSLSLNAQVKFIKPPHSDGSNVAISDVVSEVYVKDNIRRLRATVEVYNYSLKPASAELTLTVDDDIESKMIELRGDYSEKFIMDLDDPSSNVAHVEIIADEALTLDNSYFFWIGPQAPVKIGIMADIESSTQKSVEVFFLRKALSVSLPGSEIFDTAVISPEFIWSSPLSEFQCVLVLDAISGYTDSELGVLNDYRNSGGTLVYFSGRETAANIVKFNQANISNVRFLGYKGEINQLRSYVVTSLNKESPIVSIFEKERGDLFQFPIYKFARLSPSSNSTVLLSVAESYPFLLQEKTENGDLFIFAVSLASNWSEFPTSLSFLPLLYQIVEHTIKDTKRGIVELAVGDENSAKLLEAAGLPEDHQIASDPGVYVVQGIPLELNVTRSESDLRAVEEYDVVSRLTVTHGTNELSQIAPKFSQGQSEYSLKKPLAWLLAVFFAFELLIANRTKKGKLEF